MRVLVFTLAISLSVTALIFGYWRWFDPLVPSIEVQHAEIAQLPPPENGRLAPRVFEVKRLILSDRDAAGTLYAGFKLLPAEHITQFQGRPVERDPTVFEMHPVTVTVQKGLHLRDRLWEVPVVVWPGAYEYHARVEFCNPARCKFHVFDPLKVTFR